MNFTTLWTERNELKKKRLAICQDCESFVEETTKCKSCGCFVSYKALLPSAQCPLGKWKEALGEDPEPPISLG